MKRVIKRSLKKYQLAGEVNDQVPPTGVPTVQPLWNSTNSAGVRGILGAPVKNKAISTAEPFWAQTNNAGVPGILGAGQDKPFWAQTNNAGVPGILGMGQEAQPAANVQPIATTGQPSTVQPTAAPTTVDSSNTISLTPEEVNDDRGTTENSLSQEQIDANKKNYEENSEEQGLIKNPKKIQFFNPYGNVDIPTAASVLGSSIENKDSLGIVGSGLKLAAGLGRNIMGGMGTQNRNNQIMEDYMTTQKRDLKKVGRDGGYFGDGEFKQFIPEFKSGGEVDLPEALTGEYIGGMDKQNPMQEPNAEIENNEMVQHPSGEIQQAKGDTHEEGGMDVTLEEGTRILSDHLKLGRDAAKKLNKDFDLKLKASDTYAKALEKYNKKSGLTKIVDEQEENIIKLEKQSEIKDEETQGLNTQHLSNKINELENSKAPLEEGKKEVFEKLFEIQEKSKPKNEKEEQVFKDGGIVKALSEKYGITEERARELTSSMFQDNEAEDYFEDGGEKGLRAIREQRLKDFYVQAQVLGYEGKLDLKAKDLNTEGKALQQWMTKNHPKVVTEYARKAEMTAKGVDMLKSTNPEVFELAGLDPNKKSSSYTREEKENIKKLLGDNLDDKFYTEQFNDGLFDYRYPGAPIKGNSYESDLLKPTAPLMQNQVAANQNEITLEKVGETETEEDRARANMLLLPDQTPMRPDSLQAHLKVKRRYERVNPALISPEQNIVELNRQESGMTDTINNVPGAQRAAALANLSATSQDNINKTFQHANTFNSQAVAQADNINARTQAMEENAGALDALSYEQRQFRAKSLTDNDMRNYFNTIKQNSVRNSNEINSLNAANALAEHYQYDGNSYIQVDTPTFGKVNNLDALSEEEEKRNKTKKKTRKATARLGGRFSNKK